MNISTNVFKRCEIVLHSTKEYENPFMDVDIDAVFTHESGRKITLPGFWNGKNEWKVRFSADRPGTWSYTVTCTDQENPSLCDNGIIEALPCHPQTKLEKHGYVRLDPQKRYMVYEDGTPFFYLGDTHWMMPDYERLHECNYPGCTCGNQFKHTADDRIRKGFNVYQTYFSAARTATTRGGTPSWWKKAYTLIDPEAFNQTMDIMIEYLAQNGITTALGFGTHYATIHSFHQDPKPLLAFARYCVARYACYPLIWITAQEITNLKENAFTLWKQVGQLVGELDGYHRPNGAHMHVHPITDPRSAELNRQPWHQWWTVQGGHGGNDQLRPRSFYQGYYENTENKPFIETECQYEDIHCSGFCGHDAPRMGAWQAVQCGSAGFTYGVTGLWAMGWNQKDDQNLIDYSPEPWFVGLDKPGSEQVCYMKKFYEYVGWSQLTPSFGHELGIFEMRKYVSISHKEQDIFIYYFFSKDPETGTLRGLKKNTRYQARWFDSINGKFIDLPAITTETGETDIPPRPSLRDWVLLLNTADLGDYETEIYPEYIQPIPAADAILGEEIKIAALKASSEEEAHPAENLTDGNPQTYWRGFAPLTSQTITADLGSVQEVGYLHIECNMPAMRFIEFRIYGSVDGEHYEMLAERLGRCVAVGGKFPRFFDPIKGNYRYIRLFINSTNEAPQLELSKFAVYKKGE